MIPQQYKDYLSEFQQLLQPQQLNYRPMSREQLAAELQSALRPGVDLAIQQRKAATKTDRGNLDVDAYSRGMGASTYLTDVKDRMSGQEAQDIMNMEAQYGAALSQQLMNALQNERANQMNVDQFNIGLQNDMLKNALGLSGDFYAQYLSDAKKKGKSSGGSGGLTNAAHELFDRWETSITNKPENRTALLTVLNKGGFDTKRYGKGINEYMRNLVTGQ